VEEEENDEDEEEKCEEKGEIERTGNAAAYAPASIKCHFFTPLPDFLTYYEAAK